MNGIAEQRNALRWGPGFKVGHRGADAQGGRLRHVLVLEQGADGGIPFFRQGEGERGRLLAREVQELVGVRGEDVRAGDEDPVDVVDGQVGAVGVFGEADGLEEQREGRLVDVEGLRHGGAVGDERHPAGGGVGNRLVVGGGEGGFAVDAAAVGVDGFVSGEVLLADWGAGAVGAYEEAALVRGAVFECGGYTIFSDGV